MKSLAYPRPPDRRRRVEVFPESYGWAGNIDIVEEVRHVQEGGIASVAKLAIEGRQPQAQWVADGHLEELRQRVGWTLSNRALFEP